MEINEAGKSEDSILDYCEVSSLDRHAGRCAHQALTPNTTSRLYYACLGLN